MLRFHLQPNGLFLFVVLQFVRHISTLKHIDVKDNDSATIELDMDLMDPNSKIYLYKVRHQILYSLFVCSLFYDIGSGLAEPHYLRFKDKPSAIS